jgi:fatty-acyl-CoA synthase
MITLASAIAFPARRTPDRCALKYLGEDISYAGFNGRISYAGFNGRIGQVAGWLASRGIGANDVVAVLMKNSTAFLELVFATSHIGAVFLPINYRLSRDEVSYIVGNSGARILIADEEFVMAVSAGGPVVVLGEGTALGLTDLTTHCRARLAGFKIPKQLIIRDSLPRNPSGKILKRVLRAELEAHA